MLRVQNARPLLRALVVLTSLALNSAAPAEAQSATPQTQEKPPGIDFPVTLRSTAAATIHVDIYENTAVAQGTTVLALHGLSATGRTFELFAKALFAHPKLGKGVKRVLALDMVGHGDSSLPRDPAQMLQFGTLFIEDYVDVVIQSIGALRSRGYAPQMLLGHSLGGLEILAAQQTLLSRGSSLARLGIVDALVFAPLPPHDRPWTKPASSEQLAPYYKGDAERGLHMALPPAFWIASSFTDSKGALVPNAPTEEDVIAKGYSAPESLFALFQIVETGGTITPRPTISPNVFLASRGTRLTVVSLSEDLLVLPADVKDLYGYLTGDSAGKRYLPIVAPNAVHYMLIADPTALIAALAPLF